MPEPLRLAHAHDRGQAYGIAICLRPFLRRACSTLRPPFVLMRARKPCVRFRGRRFGWYVRFGTRTPFCQG